MNRTSNIVNTGWKFQLGDSPDAWQKGFDDGAWGVISLPHDWSVSLPFDRHCSSGTGYLPGGTSYYRKTFHLPEDAAGKRILLTFDGVYNNSRVWINGNYLGEHPNGYTPFTYDLSHFACFGDTPNIIAVRVAHNDLADSRWFTGSGIYRKVSLTITDRVALDTDGVFVYTDTVGADSALLRVEAEIVNDGEADAELDVRCIVYDAEGEAAGNGSTSVSAMAGGRDSCGISITVGNPRLWSVESPYLYRVVTGIYRSGELLDETEVTTGIRTFSFDPDEGFFLNGVGMKLKGVCVHHDAGCLGAAVHKKVWRSRLQTFKAIGVNAIRMSHNPHMPELYDLCDEMGFLAIDEAFDEWEGPKNKWSTGHNVYPPVHYGYFEHFPQWHEADLSALVRRNRNHPSVILWSIGNEIDYPNDPYCHPLFNAMEGNNDKNKPLTEMMYSPNKPNAERITQIARRLREIVLKHDGTRPVTAALAFPELSNLTGYAQTIDVVGYNYKEHLYADDHAKYPRHILMGSENDMSLENWLAVAENDYISGQFLWTGVDFLGETEIWPCHGSHAGLLDMAGNMKPVAYFRQSLWAERPMVKLFATENADIPHIYNRDMKESWGFAVGEDVDVICFTNCPEAEFFLNGESLGIQRLADHMDTGYLTLSLPYRKGVISVKACGANGERVEDRLEPTTASVALSIAAANGGIAADGEDICILSIKITGEDGLRADTAENLIHVVVKNGSLLGLENGDQYDTQDYALPYRRARRGRLTAYIRSSATPGAITVTASAAGMRSASTTIQSI